MKTHLITLIKRYLETPTLLASVIKWFILSSISGIIVGFSTSLFLHLLEVSVEATGHLQYFYLLAPAGFFISTLLIKRFAPNAEGHGTEKVIEAIHRESGRVNPLIAPVKLIATIISIATGGSAGKEGPAAQIGGSLTSTFAGIFKLSDTDRKKLVVCGISAGFSSVFGTPLAGAIFGVEVLFVGQMFYSYLFPSFVSGIIAYMITTKLGVHMLITPAFTLGIEHRLFLYSVVSGIFFGIVSLIFIELMEGGRWVARHIKAGTEVKALLGGLVIAILGYVFSGRYTGLGMEEIGNALTGNGVHPLSPLWKMVFTSITLNFGGSGGILTPLFYTGTMSGSVFAGWFGLDRALFAALGLVSVLSGAANTPIAGSIMAIELFGPSIAPYAGIACVISFIVSGHRSVYPSQILLSPKSPSIQVDRGKEIHRVRPVLRKKGD